jgi:hypothetical protein
MMYSCHCIFFVWMYSNLILIWIQILFSNTMHNNSQPRSRPISLLSLCMGQWLANLPQQSASPPSLRLSYRWSHLSSYPSVPAMSRWRLCSAKISPESTIVWLPHCLQKNLEGPDPWHPGQVPVAKPIGVISWPLGWDILAQGLIELIVYSYQQGASFFRKPISKEPPS